MSVSYLGNKEILNNYKVGFLCSRKVPADIILKTYDWAIEQREKGVCVVSGFHSKIERDVLHYLLKGAQPIIIVLARDFYKRMPEDLKEAFSKGRLLFVVPFENPPKRVSLQSSIIRNKFILEKSDEIFIPYVKPGGNLNKLIKGDELKTNINFDF